MITFFENDIAGFECVVGDFIGGVIDFSLDKCDGRGGCTFALKQEAYAFFAAEPDSFFHDVAVDFDESRVFTADVAKALFPEVANHVAEPVLP